MDLTEQRPKTIFVHILPKTKRTQELEEKKRQEEERKRLEAEKVFQYS